MGFAFFEKINIEPFWNQVEIVNVIVKWNPVSSSLHDYQRAIRWKLIINFSTFLSVQFNCLILYCSQSIFNTRMRLLVGISSSTVKNVFHVAYLILQIGR